MNTQAKALAGGLAGAVSSLVLYALWQVPVIGSLPAEQAGALTTLVTIGVGYLLVYWAPANRPRG